MELKVSEFNKGCKLFYFYFYCNVVTQSMPINSGQSSTLSWWIVLLVSVLVVIIAILVAVTMIYSSTPSSAFDVTATTATTIQMPSMPVTHSRGEPNHDATSVIDDYASELREKYNETLTRYKDPNINKYPAAGPTAPDKAVVPFIPLKLIRVKSQQKKEDAEFLFRANKENLKRDTFEEIEIDDISKPLTDKRLRFVLIEGEPGIGKSTLAKELALRWVRKTDEFLINYKIVILIPLRFETYQEAENIEDLLIDVEDINETEVMSTINKTRGASVLWILDGFDELPYQLRISSTSIFIKLIKGDILSKSTVIVTSRHAAIFPLLTFLEDDSKLIALRGFGSNEILEYASKYFKNEKLASEFHSYYSRNTMIESMLYNPMTCFIMCTIFNDFILTNNTKYPSTMTAIYNYYVRVLLKRHLIDTKVIDINDDCNMPQHLICKIDFDKCELRGIWEDFYYLSKIAYNKVLKQEYVFGKELHDIPKLSMMNTIISFTVFDKDESSSFIHTTLQEYFAAIYLVNNPDSIFTEEDLQQNSNLEVVLTFYVGLLKFIDKKVDNKIIDMIFNHVDDIRTGNYVGFSLDVPTGYLKHDEIISHDDLQPYTQLTSLMLRCMYEHDSLVYSTAFLQKNYVFSHIRHDLNINLDLNIRVTRDFEYFICGYVIAAHNITLKIEPYNSSEIIAFNKGLQSHSSVNGKMKITLYDYNIHSDSNRSMITEVLALPSDVVIGLHLISIDNASTCNNIFSKFSSLQEIIFERRYCSKPIVSKHPLLKLKKLKDFTLRIGELNNSAFELLRELTAHGRPLKRLHVCVKGVESMRILNLIKMQSSLEELRIEMAILASTYKTLYARIFPTTNTNTTEELNKGVVKLKFIWCKRNNSLTVDSFVPFALVVKAYQDRSKQEWKIQLSSFSSFQGNMYIMTVFSKPLTTNLIDLIMSLNEYVSFMKTEADVTYNNKTQINNYSYGMISKISPTDRNFFACTQCTLDPNAPRLQI